MAALRSRLGKTCPRSEKSRFWGDDGGSAFIAFRDEIVEVLVVWRRHGFRAEVIDDEQCGPDNNEEVALESTCGPGGVELSQQLGLCDDQHIVAGCAGEVSEGLCDVAFACAAGSGDEYRDFFLDEGTGGQVLDEGLIGGGVEGEGEVEALEGFLAAEARASQAEVELLCSLRATSSSTSRACNSL